MYTLRELVWRYTALHFENGLKLPFPEPIPYPGSRSKEPDAEQTWETAALNVAPEVQALLRGE